MVKKHLDIDHWQRTENSLVMDTFEGKLPMLKGTLKA